MENQSPTITPNPDQSLSKENSSQSVLEKYDLKEWQFAVVKQLMLPKAFRENRIKFAGRWGITERQYYVAARNPKVIQAKRDLTKFYFSDDIPDVVMAIRDSALSGNAEAAKVFLQYVDDWQSEMIYERKIYSMGRGEVKEYIEQLRTKII